MKSQKRVRVSHRRCVFSPHTHGKAWKQTLSSAKTLRSNTAPRNTYAELSAEIFAIFLAKTVYKKQKRQLQDAERAEKALLRAEKKAMKAKRLAEVSIIADAEKEAKRLAQEEKKKEKEEKKKAELAAQTQEGSQRTKRVNQQTEPKRTKVKKEKKEEQPTSSAPKTEKKSKKEKKERQQTEEVHVKVIEPTQTPKNTPVDTPAEAPATPAEYDLEHAAIINAAIPPKIEEVDIAQNDKKKSDKKNKKEKKAAEVVEEPVKAVEVPVAEASPAPAVEAEPVKEETQSEVSQKSEKKSRRNKKNSHRHSESQAPVDEPVVDVSDEVIVEVNQPTSELLTVSQTTPLAEAPSAEESLVEKSESPNTSGKKSRRHKKNSQRMSESSTHVDEKQTIAEPVQAPETPVEVEEPVTHAEVTEDDKHQLEEVQTTDAQPEPKEPEVHPESDHDNAAETLVEAEQAEALAPAGEARTAEDEAQTPFKAAQALVTEMQALVQEAQSHLHKKQTEMETVEVLVNEAKTLVKDAEQEDAPVDASQAPTFEKVVVETLTNNDVEEESPIMQDEASADLSPETTTDHSNGKKKSRRQKRNSTRKSESQPEPVEEPIIQKVEVSAVTAENTERSGAEPHGKHHRKGKKHGKTSESLDDISDAQAADEGITAPISEKKRHKKHSERKSESNNEEPKSVESAVPEPSTVDNVMLEQSGESEAPVLEEIKVLDADLDHAQELIDHDEGQDANENWEVPSIDKKRQRRSEHKSESHPDAPSPAEEPLPETFVEETVVGESTSQPDEAWVEPPKEDHRKSKRRSGSKKFSESASDVPRQPSVEIPPVLESAITETVTIEHAQSKKQSRKDKKKSHTNSESISDETNVVPEPSEPVELTQKMDVEPEKIEVSATVSKAEDGSTVIYTTGGPILSNVRYSETLDVKLVYAGTSELEGSNKKSSRRGKKNKGRHSESSVLETPAADEPKAAAPTFDIWEEFASGKPVFKDEEAEEVVEKKAVNGSSEAPTVQVEEELCQKKEFVLNQESKANEVPVAKEETKPAKAAARVPVAPAKKEKKSRRQRKKEHTSQDSSSSPEPSHTPTPQITEEVIIPSEHPSTFVSAENEEPKGQTTLNEDFEIIEHSYPIDGAKEHTTVAKKGENEIEHGKKEKKSRRGKKKSHSSETGQTEITEEIVAEMSSEVKGINGTAHVSPIQVNEVTSTAAEQEGQRVLQETIKTSVEVDSSSANPTQFAQNVQKLVESTLKDKDINVNDPNVKVNVQATLVKLTEKENKPKVVYEHKPITLAFERQRTVFERPTRERVYKLLNKDIIYCSSMIDQYGEDYEGMAKDPKNVYRDSARMIQRKMRIFRESPHFATYQKAKELGKDVAEILEPETA